VIPLASSITGLDQVRRCRARLPSVRFALHRGRCAAMARTDKMGQQETLALQHTAPLFDHLVGLYEERERDGYAERFRSLAVDHQFELVGTPPGAV
jgi:hypothetical protein